jgi:hypothetical protein
MKEEWLIPGAVVPVDPDTTKALADEIKRLIGVIGGMALQQAEKRQWVSLTDEEIDKTRFAIQTKAITQRDHELSRAIEAKLRSKNNG